MTISHRLFILVLLSSVSVFAHNPGADSLLNNYVRLFREYKNIPSIAGGISRDGKTVWMGGSGSIDLESPEPVHPSQSVYRLASISKMITAVAILQLVEARKISLDEDVRKYVPYYPKKKWNFTIRQVLQHTSGLRAYKDGEFDSKTHFNSVKDVVNYLSQDSLMFEPGTNYLYSSLAYTFLAAAIESVTGMSYANYMHKNIFEKAGMKSTYFDDYRNIIRHRVKGYIKNDYREMENAPLADLSIKYPGGGIMSTVEDMLSFGNKLLQGDLISKRYIDTMYEQLKLKNGQTRSYGLGVAMWNDSHKRFMFGHIGGGTGFTTQLILMPKEKIVSIYLINAKDRFNDNPAVTFIETVLGDTIPQVKKPLSDRLLGVALANGAEAALKTLKTITADSSKYYILGESEILLCGDDLMRVNRQRDAIVIYSYCTEQNPNSLNPFIGLADAYLKDGNKGLALKAFIRAAKIDPHNSYANKMIKKLESQR